MTLVLAIMMYSGGFAFMAWLCAQVLREPSMRRPKVMLALVLATLLWPLTVMAMAFLDSPK